MFPDRRGFTLIELLVVISIISLLTSVMLSSFSVAKEKARIARALQFEASMYHAKGIGAVGIWLFDEGTGNIAKDSSGDSNHLAVPGSGVTWNTVEEIPNHQSYLYFAGSGYLTGTNPKFITGTSGFTYMAWIKPDYWTGPNPIGIISRESPSGWAYLTLTVAGPPHAPVLNFNYRDENGVFRLMQAASLGSTGKWYHVAVTTDESGYAKTYLDGRLEAISDYRLGNDNIGNKLYVGSYTTFFPFQGNIDSVYIFNHGLSMAQIQQFYAEQTPKYLAKNK